MLGAAFARQAEQELLTGDRRAAAKLGMAAASLFQIPINAWKASTAAAQQAASGLWQRGVYSARSKAANTSPPPRQILPTPADLLAQVPGLRNLGNTCFIGAALTNLLILGLRVHDPANFLALVRVRRGNIATLPLANAAVTDGKVVRLVARVFELWVEAMLAGPANAAVPAAGPAVAPGPNRADLLYQRNAAYVVLISHLRRRAFPYQRATGPNSYSQEGVAEFFDKFAMTAAGADLLQDLTGFRAFDPTLRTLDVNHGLNVGGDNFFIIPEAGAFTPWCARLRLPVVIPGAPAVLTSFLTDILPKFLLSTTMALQVGNRFGLLVDIPFGAQPGPKLGLYGAEFAADAQGVLGTIILTDSVGHRFTATVTLVAHAVHVGPNYLSGHFVSVLHSTTSPGTVMELNDGANEQCFAREATSTEGATVFSLLITVTAEGEPHLGGGAGGSDSDNDRDRVRDRSPGADDQRPAKRVRRRRAAAGNNLFCKQKIKSIIYV